MACAMVASGSASSTASRSAWTLPPMTRVTRAAMLSVTVLLPHLARSGHDVGDFQNGRQMLVYDGGAVAAGAARDGEPEDRHQQLKTALDHDLLDVDRTLLGVLGQR